MIRALTPCPLLALLALTVCACTSKPTPETRKGSEAAPHVSQGVPEPEQPKASPVNVITIAPNQGPPRYLVVLLHGVGDQASGFQGVGQRLARSLPQAEILVPDGFHPFDGGGAGRQWFSRVGLTDENRSERIRAAAAEVSQWIDGELAQHGLPAERLIVGGFSQGAMVAGSLALHRQPSPAAVVMLSGRLAEPAGEPAPRVSVPVFVGHGSADPVIPVTFAQPAAELLEARGASVTKRIYPGMEHHISNQEMADIEEFLAKVLPP